MTSLEQRLKGVDSVPEWSPPTIFHPKNDQQAIEALLDSGGVRQVADSIDMFAETMGEMGLLSDGQLPEDRTRWVYFPWDEQLVRYPDRDAHWRIRTYRNIPLIRAHEQGVLYNTRGAYFGLSVGGKILDQNLESGVGNAYMMGDFDRLDPTNLNRIRADMSDVGLSKIAARAKRTSKIDPYIRQVHVPAGYTMESAPALLEKFRPDYIVEAVDNIAVKAMLRAYAAQHNTPLLMVTDLGEKAPVDVERYDLAETTKPFNGKLQSEFVKALCEGRELSEAEKTRTLIKLSGGVSNIPPRVIEAAKGMREGTIGGIPQLGATAARGAVDADFLLRNILLYRTVPPRTYQYDPYREFGLGGPDSLADVAMIYRDFMKTQKESNKHN